MNTTIQAAELATRSGVTVVIANGARDNVIVDTAAGLPVGTRFLAQARSIEGRKRWILSERPAGTLRIDDGAARALRQGKSLLPVGVHEVTGDFDRGGIVDVHDANGRAIARGIARYSAVDAKKIAGRQSDQIESILGYDFAPMLVHADDMVVIDG